MARLKKGEKKKIPISFRLEPETIERLKKIDKFHSKIDVFINKGIDDYERFLERHIIEVAAKQANIPFYDLTECNGSPEILNSNNDFLDVFRDEEFRLSYIDVLKKLNDYYDNEIFFKFHKDIYDFQKKENMKLLDLLENWNETKALLNKKLNDINKINNGR